MVVVWCQSRLAVHSRMQKARPSGHVSKSLHIVRSARLCAFCKRPLPQERTGSDVVCRGLSFVSSTSFRARPRSNPLRPPARTAPERFPGRMEGVGSSYSLPSRDGKKKDATGDRSDKGQPRTQRAHRGCASEPSSRFCPLTWSSCDSEKTCTGFTSS